jgi:NAD(P)-dependent dehydrogenase (short-subunit alcohol dehydrogenase family)
VAIGFAKEGADVVILYGDPAEDGDAQETLRHIEAAGRRGMAIMGDVGDPTFVQEAVEHATAFLDGPLDILVNNAAEQHETEDFAEIPTAQVERTFRTNILGYIWMIRSCLPRMAEGCRDHQHDLDHRLQGQPELPDYAAPKGPSWR